MFYNRNLVKVIGRWIGMWSCRVELRNIVVGDLPWRGRGDFFLAVDCAYNPTMVTSVAENADPKVLHFPEVLSLRLRNHPLERCVKITVKEVDFVGFNDICEVRLSTPNVIDWSQEGNEDDRVKRFEMKPVDRTSELITPPWILLEFGEASDERRIDELEARPNTIRLTKTTLQPDGTTVRHLEDDLDPSGLKDLKPLLDGTGASVQEPDESDLSYLRRLAKCLWCLYSLFRFIVFIIILLYSILRAYVWSCFREFTKLTIASLKGEEFPISAYDLREIWNNCERDVAGEHLDPGTNPCRPSANQTLGICANVPEGQPRPSAFVNTINEWFNLDVPGVKCFNGICEFREAIAPWDLCCLGFIIGSLFVLCLCHCGFDRCIRSERQRAAAKHTRRMRNLRKGRAKDDPSDDEHSD